MMKHLSPRATCNAPARNDQPTSSATDPLRARRSPYVRCALTALCLVGLLLCLVGCGSAQQKQGEPASQDQAADKAQGETSPEAAQDTLLSFEQGTMTYGGNCLTVQLDENLTTGYEWTAALEGSGLVLDDQGSITAADLTEADKAAGGKSEPMVGQGGYHVYGFTGTAASKQTITFTYARSWEKSADDIVIVASVETDGAGSILAVDLDIPHTTTKA